ncbi:MAG: TadE/TadG family type IV pilus assembly protein [Methylocella sp.]
MAAFGLAARFMRDRSGAYGVTFGLMAPVFIGALALGSETGGWYSTHEKMQGAADSAAISAAVGINDGNTNMTLQADAAASSYGFVNGSNGTTVSVNQPPLSGPNVVTPGAVEVIIKQPQKTLFSSLFLKSPVVVQGRSVAVAANGIPCVIALNHSLLVAGITVQLASAVLADKCNVADNSPSPFALTVDAASSITAQKINVVGGFVNILGFVTTTQGVHTGAPATVDPFAGTTVDPTFTSLPCNPNSFSPTVSSTNTITGTVTLSPGRYCGGILVGAGGTVTLSPGTYYMDGNLLSGALKGGLTVKTGGSVTGTGVTIVLTTSGPLSNLLSLDLGGLFPGGVINLTAPTSGQYAGLVLFADPGATLAVLTLRGGTQNNLVGTIYAPFSTVLYALSSGTKTGQCTRLIADTINFAVGSASFSKCAVTDGLASSAPAQIVE